VPRISHTISSFLSYPPPLKPFRNARSSIGRARYDEQVKEDARYLSATVPLRQCLTQHFHEVKHDSSIAITLAHGSEDTSNERKRQWEPGQANEQSYPISPAQVSHPPPHRVQHADSTTILPTSRVREYSHADRKVMCEKGEQR